MRYRIPAFTAAFCLLCSLAWTQAIDNSISYRMIDGDRYFRISYENDFFAKSDLYYTQGIHLETVSPYYADFLLSKALIAPRKMNRQYGIALEHSGYTPTSISHKEIMYGDRPYAAAVLFKTFSTSVDSEHRIRIASSLSLGMVGPGARGNEIQTAIHRWIGDEAPQGWQHQIHNDLVLNYEMGIEKNIWQAGTHVLVNLQARGRIGTLSTEASAGPVLLLGKFNAAISRAFCKGLPMLPSPASFSFHAYFHPVVNLIGYDATMQGGFFDRTSPYTIASADIERFTLQFNGGLVVQFHSIYMEYSQTALTPEFRTGRRHGWGGIRLGIKW